ncbi:hypothetical protein EGW08_007967 [Elysia chlorotica]|uniref:G-protein coupled receptors family 1 profile domain-containing protein n=1 Tax=Elysia chlorotica TaxID=188477 RepID=A0A3S0ZVX1_ELYCH|nr:hypothetical protein EGW08_007967 [Elysia chlorotica]
MANNTTFDLSHLLYRYPSRTALLEEFAPAAPLADKIVPPFWYFIGFLGNPISAAVWLGQRMRRNNSSAIYLGALSIADLIFLFLHLMYVLHMSWGHDIYNAEISCEIFHFAFYVPQYLSTFLVLAFTAERYVAVCHPFLKEKLCTVQRAVVVVFSLLAFSLVLSSAQAYIWTFSAPENSCNVRPEAAVGDHWSFWSVWNWVTDIFAFGLVPLTVLIFNVLVLKEIYKISRKDALTRQHSQINGTGGGRSSGGNSSASTVMLLSVSSYFIFTQLSATIINCLNSSFPHGEMNMTDSQIRADKTWSSMFTYLEVRKVVEVICMSHYACYFFIYCLTGKHFRKEVLRLMTMNGKIQFLNTLVTKSRRKERYSMVSTNGGPTTETFATNFSTTM